MSSSYVILFFSFSDSFLPPLIHRNVGLHVSTLSHKQARHSQSDGKRAISLVPMIAGAPTKVSLLLSLSHLLSL